MPPRPELRDELAPWAMESVLDLRLDESLTNAVDQLTAAEVALASPWLLCYQAMERRLSRGDYSATLRLAQAAIQAFNCASDAEGQARAMAEAAIARYHLGQYALALSELAACPQSERPSCIAAVALATYINQIGINALPAAIQAADRGLRAIEHEANPSRRAIWRIVLQRNLIAAHHYRGELTAARAAAEDAVQLAETYHTNSYLYDWALYEQGLLEQRAGRRLSRRQWLRIVGMSGLAVAAAGATDSTSGLALAATNAQDETPEGFLAHAYAQRGQAMTTKDLRLLDAIYDTANPQLLAFEKDRTASCARMAASRST